MLYRELLDKKTVHRELLDKKTIQEKFNTRKSLDRKMSGLVIELAIKILRKLRISDFSISGDPGMKEVMLKTGQNQSLRTG